MFQLLSEMNHVVQAAGFYKISCGAQAEGAFLVRFFGGAAEDDDRRAMGRRLILGSGY